MCHVGSDPSRLRIPIRYCLLLYRTGKVTKRFIAALVGRLVDYRRLLEILVRNKCIFFFTFQILYQHSVIIQRTHVQAVRPSPVPSPGTRGRSHLTAEPDVGWFGLRWGQEPL